VSHYWIMRIVIEVWWFVVCGVVPESTVYETRKDDDQSQGTETDIEVNPSGRELAYEKIVPRGNLALKLRAAITRTKGEIRRTRSKRSHDSSMKHDSRPR